MIKCYKCEKEATHIGILVRFFEKINEQSKMVDGAEYQIKKSPLSSLEVTPNVLACDEHLDTLEILNREHVNCK